MYWEILKKSRKVWVKYIYMLCQHLIQFKVITNVWHQKKKEVHSGFTTTDHHQLRIVNDGGGKEKNRSTFYHDTHSSIGLMYVWVN